MEIGQQPDRNIHQFHVTEELRSAPKVQNLDRFHSTQQTTVYENVELQRLIVNRLIVFDTVQELNANKWLVGRPEFL